MECSLLHLEKKKKNIKESKSIILIVVELGQEFLKHF